MAGTNPAKKAETRGNPERPAGTAGLKTSPDSRVTRKAPTIRIPSASVLVKVMTLSTIAPGLIPRAWNPARPRSIATESAVVLAGDRPTSRDEYWPSATATAAVAADWTISSSDQPWRNATSGWKASRKKAYWPPTRGTTVESSAKTKAPKSAITPPAAQTPRISSGVSTVRATT